MSVEEYREASDQLCRGKMTLRDYWKLINGWEIDDVNEFLQSRGSRLNTKNMRLKKESDVRVIFLHLIWDALRRKPLGHKEDSGISMGELNYGSYLLTKRRRERERRRANR